MEDVEESECYTADDAWDDLTSWVQSRCREDLKMISLVLFYYHMRHVNPSAMKSAAATAEIVDKSERTIRRWKDDFELHGREFSFYARGKYSRHSIISNEDCRAKASKWARDNSCVRGSPNMTVAHFAQYINNDLLPSLRLPPGFPASISISTAGRFLHSLGFERVSANRKSVYLDGHERLGSNSKH